MKDYKTLVIIVSVVILLILIVIGTEWLKSDNEGSSPVPYNLVTTFKGDAATSRAFNWYTTDPGAGSVLEYMQGTASTFAAGKGRRVEGSTAVIQTDKGERGVHQAEVTGLAPGTTYTYRAGSGAEGEWSKPAEFTTAEAGSESAVFINVTDSQGQSRSDFQQWGNTLETAFRIFPGAEFMVHNGDLTEDPDHSEGWNYFFAYMQGRAAGIPLMPVAGNHDEVDGEAGFFASHFNLPDNGAEGSNAGTSYSFDYGPVHLTVLNTESNLKEQALWLEKDLASTDKPWKIVALHRPVYGGNAYSKIEKWADLFDDHAVDLVLQGHNHEYSRSYPLLNGKIVTGEIPSGAPRGTVYVVTNASGAKFNEKKEDRFYHEVHFQNDKPMFAGITVNGDTLTYEAYDVEGKKLDSFTLHH